MEANKNIEVSSSKLKVDVKEFVPKSAHLQSFTAEPNVLETSRMHFEDHTTNLYVHCDPGPYNVEQSLDYFGGQSAAPFQYQSVHNNISPRAAWPPDCREELYSLFPTEAKKKNRRKKMTEISGESVKKENCLPREVSKPITSNIWGVEPKVKIWSRKDKLPANEINVASMNWPGLENKHETQDKVLKGSQSKEESSKKTFAELLKQPMKPKVDDNQVKKSDLEAREQRTKSAKQLHEPNTSGKRLQAKADKSEQTKSKSTAQVKSSYKPAHNKKQSHDSIPVNDGLCFDHSSLDTRQTRKKSINLNIEKYASTSAKTVGYKGAEGKMVAEPQYVEEKLINSPISWSSVVSKKGGQTLYQQKTAIKECKQTDECEEAKLSRTVSNSELPNANIKDKHDEAKLPNADKKELTEEERELLRIKRRERRKREKETKKKLKEEEQRKKIYEPKTSKIKMISSDILQKVNKSPTKEVDIEKRKGIKFLDEEYPDLLTGKKKIDKPSTSKSIVLSREARDGEGKLISDAESNSEWETEDESKLSGYDTGTESGLQSDLDDACPERLKVDIDVAEVKQEPQLSYSSILKSKSVPKDNEKKSSSVESKEVKTDVPDKVEKKKVKKKDPIAFDLFSAFKANIQKQKQPAKKVSQMKSKSTGVLGGKLQKEGLGTSVRNQLDSTAPIRRRGKEREGGKKKRPTLMKKIILVDREKRKLARKEAEARRTERIQMGITLKPLEPQDLFETSKSAEETDTIVEKENDNQNDGDVKSEDKEEIILKNSSDVDNEDMVLKNNDANHNELEVKAKLTLHSRKFRDYCTNDLSPELDKVVSNLMTDLVRFQDKQHEKDPVKAKARRRYVVGLREVKKFLKVKKVNCLIIAPDMEKVATEGGLDDCVSNLQDLAKENSIAVIFALNRRKLGRICKKKVPVSCIGIMNQQGSDENYNMMLELATNLQNTYTEKLQATMNNLAEKDKTPDYRQQFCHNSNGVVPNSEFDFMHQFQNTQTPFGLNQHENFSTDLEMSLTYTSNQVASDYFYSNTCQQMSNLSVSDAYKNINNSVADDSKKIGGKIIDILRN